MVRETEVILGKRKSLRSISVSLRSIPVSLCSISVSLRYISDSLRSMSISLRYISVTLQYVSVSLLSISVSLRYISVSSLSSISVSLRSISVSLLSISVSLLYISVSLRSISVSLRSISFSLRYISVSPPPSIPSPISYYFLVGHTLKIQNYARHSPFLSAVPTDNHFIDLVLQIAVSLKVCAMKLNLCNYRSWCLVITQLATFETLQCWLNHRHFLVLSVPLSQPSTSHQTKSWLVRAHYTRCNSIPPPATFVTACLAVYDVTLILFL